jgi:hypothetical protein
VVNSLQRLFAEIIETLDRAGQNVTDSYARSQVFAVIDILTNLAHRVEWKRTDIQASVDDLRALFADIATLLGEKGSYPAALTGLRERLAAAARESLSADLLAERDRLNRLLIDLMTEVAAVRSQLPVTVADTIEQRCDGFLRRQLDRDLALVRRPLFRRMSQG